MRIRNALTALLFAGVLACPLAAADTAAELKTYTAAGRMLVDMANSQKIDVAVLEAKVLELTKASVPLARAYAAKFPAGKQAIDMTIAAAATVDAAGQVTGLGPMKDMPFKEIEEQWHDLNHFKTHPVGIDMSEEANEHFTDPLHTVIHPFLTLAAGRAYAKGAKADDLKAMKAEMEEGLEQAEKLVEALNKK